MSNDTPTFSPAATSSSAADRFFGRVLATALERGLLRAGALLEQFPPRRLMAELSDAPSQRRALLGGIGESAAAPAVVASVVASAEALEAALRSGRTDAASVLARVDLNALGAVLDKEGLWRVFERALGARADAAGARRACELLVLMLDTAVSSGLAKSSDLFTALVASDPERAFTGVAPLLAGMLGVDEPRSQTLRAPAPTEVDLRPPPPERHHGPSTEDSVVTLPRVFAAPLLLLELELEPTGEDERPTLMEELNVLGRLPPGHAWLPVPILRRMVPMCEALIVAGTDEERHSIIRAAFDDERALRIALLALIELLEPTVNVRDPAVHAGELDALVHLVCFEERTRYERLQNRRTGKRAVHPPPLPASRPRATPPPLPSQRARA